MRVTAIRANAAVVLCAWVAALCAAPAPAESEASTPAPWVERKGLDIFMLGGLKAPFSPITWDSEQWAKRWPSGLKGLALG